MKMGCGQATWSLVGEGMEVRVWWCVEERERWRSKREKWEIRIKQGKGFGFSRHLGLVWLIEEGEGGDKWRGRRIRGSRASHACGEATGLTWWTCLGWIFFGPLNWAFLPFYFFLYWAEIVGLRNWVRSIGPVFHCPAFSAPFSRISHIYSKPTKQN